MSGPGEGRLPCDVFDPGVVRLRVGPEGFKAAFAIVV